jgi:hypothetical protein
MSGGLAGRLGDGGHRVQELHRQGLGTATAVGDAVVDLGARLRRRDPLGESRRVQEDLAAVVAGDEPEAALGVEPLDLAGRHGEPRS